MNLFKDLPEALQEEIFETIVKTKDITLERIVSKGHVTQEGEAAEQHWYDQDQHEWVTILSGWARLSFENNKEVLLKPGDHLIIPAHKRHMVKETDASQETIWLALFYTAA